MRTSRPSRAFTLVELLIVVAIIAILVTVLVPSLGRVRRMTQSVLCLSNLRQFVIAAHNYARDYNEHYPPAYSFKTNGTLVSYAWDYTSTRDWSTRPPTTRVRAGLLWSQRDVGEIHQCPSFRGAHNWLDDPHTGYNYNTSYIGHGSGESIAQSACMGDVKRPAETALFGDGEYASGANKFMRAPLPNPGDAGFSGRYAGTQGYRHLDKTNVGFCDGHAASWAERHTTIHPASDEANIAEGTGFLSPDNSLYDLE